VSSGRKSADHQFLSAIHSIFDPCAAPFPWLVEAVLSLSNDPLEALLANRVEHVRRGWLNIIRNANSRRTELQQ
jgi:hypothetical protein